MTNEINALTKLMYWSADSAAPPGPQEEGVKSTSLLLMRLLAGKLYESWRLIHKIYFEPKMHEKYSNELDSKCNEALNSIKTYFNGKNAASLIRNNFAFHNSPDALGASPEKVDTDLTLYMQRKTPANDLFSFSEVFVERAILALLSENGIKISLIDLSGELFSLAANFINFSDCMISVIIDHNPELRSRDSIEIDIQGLMKFDEVIIPWFTETDEILS